MIKTSLKVLWFCNTPASGEEYLNSENTSGGWLSSLDKLVSDHIDLHVAFYYPKFIERFIYKGVTYHPICKKNWKWQMFKNIFWQEIIQDQDLVVYKEIIQSVKPDVIHIHGTENSFGTVLKKINVPVILSIQGNITIIRHKFFSGIFKHYASLRSYDIKKPQQIIFQKSFVSSYNSFEKMSMREIKTLKIASYVIGRTKWDKRISKIFAPNAKYFHIDEILRAPFYDYVWKPGKMKNSISIHTTNGNSPYKGFETLCHALSILNELNYDVKWSVAGINENDSIVKVTKKQLGKIYPQKGLVLLGKLNADSLVKSLLTADIYVMPSHIENSPNNLCEAMLVGMPCIATFAGGTGSLLEDGKEGILVQDGDPWVLAGAVVELINDPEKAELYGLNARMKALKRHDKHSIVNQLVSLYKQVKKSGEN